MAADTPKIVTRLRVVLFEKVEREAYASVEEGHSAGGQGWPGRETSWRRLKLG